jgi:hypothetical protein
LASFRRRVLVAAALSLGASATAHAANPIATENALPGNADFLPTASAVGAMKTIDVYPSRWSVARGDHLGIKVSTTASSFETRIYRLGAYGGAGARLVLDVPNTPGVRQPIPTPSAIDGIAECGWAESLSLTVSQAWTPGVFLVRVTGSDGFDALSYFVVRDDGAPTRAPLLFVLATATHQAYNAWPYGGTIATEGKSLYGWNSSPAIVQQSTDNWAVKVSYDRPFAAGLGAGDLLSWEYSFVRWLEQSGYDVAYATSQDVDDGPALGGRRGIVTSGHDEYWSTSVFDHLQAARDHGVSLALFSGDVAAWQIRFERSARSGDPRGVITGYKERAYPADPASGAWPGDPYWYAARAAASRGDLASATYFFDRVTGAWATLQKDPATGIDARRPGMLLTGVLHGGETSSGGFDWVVQNASHWIYAGTGLAEGDRLTGLVGYEWDNLRRGDTSWDDVRPPGQISLAFSPTGPTEPHGASYYVASSGAFVFTAGTIQWSYALAAPGAGSTPHDPRVERITKNVLDAIVARANPGFDAGPGSDDAGVIVPPEAGPDAGDVGVDGTSDAGPIDVGVDASDAGAYDATLVDAPIDATSSSVEAPSQGGCGCVVPADAESEGDASTLAALGIVIVAVARRRSPERRRSRHTA